jgi:hypothetical protein
MAASQVGLSVPVSQVCEAGGRLQQSCTTKYSVIPKHLWLFMVNYCTEWELQRYQSVNKPQGSATFLFIRFGDP